MISFIATDAVTANGNRLRPARWLMSHRYGDEIAISSELVFITIKLKHDERHASLTK